MVVEVAVDKLPVIEKEDEEVTETTTTVPHSRVCPTWSTKLSNWAGKKEKKGLGMKRL